MPIILKYNQSIPQDVLSVTHLLQSVAQCLLFIAQGILSNAQYVQSVAQCMLSQAQHVLGGAQQLQSVAQYPLSGTHFLKNTYLYTKKINHNEQRTD